MASVPPGEAAELRARTSRLARLPRCEADRRGPAMSQAAALGRLHREGAATLGEPAAGERVRPRSIARTLDALRKAGLLTRSPHPADRRRHLIALTEAGRRAVAEDRRRRDARLARTMATARSADDRALLVRAGALMGRPAGLPAGFRPRGRERPATETGPSGEEDGSGGGA